MPCACSIPPVPASSQPNALTARPPCARPQVYLAHWDGHTPVAVKLLLGNAASIADVTVAAEAVLSLSSPVFKEVQQVGAH